MWHEKNKQKYKEIQRNSKKRAKDGLLDRYVRDLLSQQIGIRRSDIPTNMVDAKRAHLKVVRLIREKTA